MRSTHNIALRQWKLILGATLILGGATFARAQEPPPTQPLPQGTSSEEASSTLSASELAKEISNPVTSLWQL